MTVIQADIYVKCPHCGATNLVILDKQVARQRDCDECGETFFVEVLITEKT